jgi:putative FmdB family regulatory protein
MPIYEYQCQSCRHDFEELVRNSKSASPPCPLCGAKKSQRQISKVAAGQTKSGQPGVCESSRSNGGIPTCGRCGDLGPCIGGA